MKGIPSAITMSTSPSGFFPPDAAYGQPPGWRSPASSALIIRPACQPDIASLSDVLASSFHRKNGWLGWLYPLLQMGIYEDLRMRLRFSPKHYACLVATIGEDEAVVGTVEVGIRNASMWSSQAASCLYISNLAVQSDYRRHGIAQRLLAACDQLALEWGYPDLYLHVLENNHTARRLYHRAGYKLCRVEAGFGFWLWGQPKQYFLCKKLHS
jgi:GNAT superfamily N-acetyltransferase